MQKETYDRLSGEKLNEIQEISNKINFNNLTYYLKTSGISPVNFIKFKGLFLFFFKEIRDDFKLLKEAEEKQIKFKSELNEITRGKPKDQSKDQSDTIENVKTLYHPRRKIINSFSDNTKIKSETIHKTKQDEKEQRAAGL